MIVAAFDFDGTITKKDTLSPYLERLVGRRRVVLAAVRSAPWLVRAVVSRAARDDAKEQLLRRCIAGVSLDRARAVGEEYAPTIELRDDVLGYVQSHVAQGHVVVLVTASPSVYVDAAARLLGASGIVATELEVRDGALTGRFATPNCRADEKRRRLAAWLASRDVEELYAYGNSVDDDPMLSLAQHPVRV